MKAGSDREFCYMMMPGQDFYHRLLDGEIFLQRHDEKLCLACASRRGLLVAEPRRLREVVIPLPADRGEHPARPRLVRRQTLMTQVASLTEALDRIASRLALPIVRARSARRSSDRSPSLLPLAS